MKSAQMLDVQIGDEVGGTVVVDGQPGSVKDGIV